MIEKAAVTFCVPQPGFVFDVEKDFYGNRLALVFGNESGACPNYSSGCRFCEIGAGEYCGHRFSIKENCLRASWFLEHYGCKQLLLLDHLLLYNSGSVLDEKQFSTQSLRSVVEILRQCCSPRVVSFDTRCEYVEEEKLVLLSQLFSGVELSLLNIGLELFDDDLRQRKLRKKLGLSDLEKVFRLLSSKKLALTWGVAINFMVGFPFLSPAESLADLSQGIDFFHRQSVKYDLPVNFNVHPFYLTAKYRRSQPASDFNFWEHNGMADLLSSLRRKHLDSGGLHVMHVGINSEGLQLSDGDCQLNKNLLKDIEMFNLSGGAE